MATNQTPKQTEKQIKPEAGKFPGSLYMSDAKKAELKAISVNDSDVKRMFEAGMTPWQITEKVFGFPFDHNDRRTWMFYRRITNIRDEKKIKTQALQISNDTRLAVYEYIKRHSESELQKLLAPKPVK